MRNVIFAISGASGINLAQTCLDEMAALPGIALHVVISEAAKKVMLTEGKLLIPHGINILDNNNLSAPPASGSWPAYAMVICPCSANTLGAIANGLASNLIQRTAQVTLKERRPLLLSLRETPYSLIMIRNMSSLTEAGAIIAPFIPAFYCGSDMQTALRQYCGHLLDLMHISNNLRKKWSGNDKFLE